MSVLALLLLLQATGPVVPAPALAPTPIVPPACPDAAPDGEVVVCARPGDEQGPRLRPLPPFKPRAAFDPLGFRLPGGGEARVHAIQSNLPTASGRGLAATMRLPLGRRPKSQPDE